MFIGNIEIKTPVVLAPMAGITDLPFRVLCKEQGAGLLVSEMVSAKGLLYNNQKTLEMLRILERERPVAIQLFGSNPAEMAQAAKIVQDHGADMIDVNMGCPVPKVVNNGDGSALMRTPQLAYEVLASMREVMRIPLTVKIRSGWDENSINAQEIAQLAEKAGVDAIAVHARTRKQMYQGQADWSIIKAVVQSVKTPVIGNGDVTSWQTAEQMLQTTGCAGVMVGRAAEGNPWIFKQLALGMQGLPAAEISISERFAMMLRHLQLLAEYKGEVIAVKEMRRHAAAYIKGLPYATGKRVLLNQTNDLTGFKKILSDYAVELSR